MIILYIQIYAVKKGGSFTSAFALASDLTAATAAATAAAAASAGVDPAGFELTTGSNVPLDEACHLFSGALMLLLVLLSPPQKGATWM